MHVLIQEARRLLEAYTGKGVMVAVYPPIQIARQLAIPTGLEPDDLHMTLAFLGDSDKIGRKAMRKAEQVCARISKTTEPIKAAISGVGRFSASRTSGGQDVYYASIDAPALPELRHRLVRALQKAGVSVAQDHGFTPHMTLSYLGQNEVAPLQHFDPMKTTFRALTLSVGSDKKHFSLAAIG